MNLSELKIGHKVKFTNDPQYWFHVRVVRHPFIILSTKTYAYYTIVDIENNIRGEGTSWGLGHGSQSELELSMKALFDEHPAEIQQEISRRNRVPISIYEVDMVSEKKSRLLEMFLFQLSQMPYKPVRFFERSPDETVLSITYKLDGSDDAILAKDGNLYTFTYNGKVSKIKEKTFNELLDDFNQEVELKNQLIEEDKLLLEQK